MSGTLAAYIIPYRPVADASSDESIQDIKNWITTCDNPHTRCRYAFSGDKIKSRHLLPTRIIDVGTGAGDSGETVRLVISKGWSDDMLL